MKELQTKLLEAFYQATMENYTKALPLFVLCMVEAATDNPVGPFFQKQERSQLFNQAYHGWNNAWVKYQQQLKAAAESSNRQWG